MVRLIDDMHYLNVALFYVSHLSNDKCPTGSRQSCRVQQWQ